MNDCGEGGFLLSSPLGSMHSSHTWAAKGPGSAKGGTDRRQTCGAWSYLLSCDLFILTPCWCLLNCNAASTTGPPVLPLLLNCLMLCGLMLLVSFIWCADNQSCIALAVPDPPPRPPDQASSNACEYEEWVQTWQICIGEICSDIKYDVIEHHPKVTALHS